MIGFSLTVVILAVLWYFARDEEAAEDFPELETGDSSPFQAPTRLGRRTSHA